MMKKPVRLDAELGNIAFLRDAKQLEFTVGNVTLDSSKLSEGQEIEGGTAVFRNEETDLYELVVEGTPADMKGAVLTVEPVKVVDKNVNVHTSALRKASVYEELITGATKNFKEATKGRITFDI